MSRHTKGRRDFLKTSLASAAALPTAGLMSRLRSSGRGDLTHVQAQETAARRSRIRFAAIGLNHGHIYGQVDAVARGGGALVSFYAKEPELAAEFSERYPGATRAGSA